MSKELVEALARVKAKLKEAETESYEELGDWENQARRCRDEGDMYGWNFYKGMEAGRNYVNIFYYRGGREIEEIFKELENTKAVAKDQILELDWHADSCPFCAENQLAFYRLPDSESRHVYCTDCRASGPWGDSDTEAVNAWNKRVAHVKSVLSDFQNAMETETIPQIQRDIQERAALAEDARHRGPLFSGTPVDDLRIAHEVLESYWEDQPNISNVISPRILREMEAKLAKAFDDQRKKIEHRCHAEHIPLETWDTLKAETDESELNRERMETAVRAALEKLRIIVGESALTCFQKGYSESISQIKNSDENTIFFLRKGLPTLTGK